MTTFLLFVLALWIGFMFGFLARSTVFNRNNYTGTIVITKENNKTLYSLILDDYPEKIAFREKAVFKIETPETPE